MSAPLPLQEGEHVDLGLRKHWLVLVARVALIVVAWLVPFLIYAYFDTQGLVPPGLRSTHIFSFAGSWWTLAVWLALAIVWTNYYLDLWIVTNRRVINVEQRGLFDRDVAAWSIEHIQEATVRQRNFLQIFFNYGTLEIHTAESADSRAIAYGIPNPDKVREKIMEGSSRIGLLEKTAKGQEQLLHTISHEVKSYLSKDAAALATIAEGTLGDIPESVRSLAESALLETRKGVSAVMDILKDTDAGRGTMRLSEQTFDLRGVLESLVAEFKPEAEKKGLVFEAALTTDPCPVCGDEIKLRDFVFRNLVDNAIRYTPKGFIRVELTRINDAVICTVTDTGVGISPETMAQLFTPGGKGAESESINPESTGFGLSSAKEVLEKLGGTIIARSDGTGKGSSFVVGLPAA